MPHGFGFTASRGGACLISLSYFIDAYFFWRGALPRTGADIFTSLITAAKFTIKIYLLRAGYFIRVASPCAYVMMLSTWTAPWLADFAHITLKKQCRAY